MEEEKAEEIPFLEQVKAEREALEKVRNELKELQSVNIISGKTDAGTTEEEKPKELTPKEYADAVTKGIIPTE